MWLFIIIIINENIICLLPNKSRHDKKLVGSKRKHRKVFHLKGKRKGKK